MEETLEINKREEAEKKIYAQIRELIKEKKTNDAETLLDAFPNERHTAEWNYLKGCILTHKGWFLDAQSHFETAYSQEPKNPEYEEAVSSLNASANGYTDTWSNEQKDTPKPKGKKICKSISDDGTAPNEFCCALCCEGGCECCCEAICDGIGNC